MSLPKIDGLLALLKGVKYFTTLELQIGYYHITLNEKFVLKSAVISEVRKYEFL